VHHVIQNTVDTKSDAKILFIRFDVDVARPAPERVNQQNIDESDDRRVFAVFSELSQIDFIIVLDQLKLSGIIRIKSKRSSETFKSE